MGTTTTHRRRLEPVRRVLKRHGLDGLLVSNRANVRYLTGFTGSAGLALVTANALYLIVDFRYFEQAAQESPMAERVHVEAAHYHRAIAQAAGDAGCRSLGFEADECSYADYLALSDTLPGLSLVPSRHLVASFREIKDAQEIVLVRRAAEATSRAVTAALATLFPGQTEREVAAEVDRHLSRLGCEGQAFETLVAFGDRTALPHPRPSDRPLALGDWVLVDAGGVVDGYMADMTRTIVFGPASPRQAAIHQAVRQALASGLQAFRPGAPASAVDAACREALAAAGMDARFGHPAGHGVGLELHESPLLAAETPEPLEPGMILTVEPGVYMPGEGGCRLEELVLVTEDGVEVLTSAPLGLASLCTPDHSC